MSKIEKLDAFESIQTQFGNKQSQDYLQYPEDGRKRPAETFYVNNENSLNYPEKCFIIENIMFTIDYSCQVLPLRNSKKLMTAAHSFLFKTFHNL